MIRDEYWDKSEYSFFMELDDEDKLLYIYDLMIGDFSDDYYNESDEFGDDDSIRTDILVMMDKSGWMSITGPDEALVNKVVNDMVMNGFILSDKHFNLLDDGDVLLQYKIVGNASPISLN